MRTQICVALALASQLLEPYSVGAQTPDGLAVFVSTYEIRRDGGERLRGASVTDATAIGRVNSSTFLHFRATGCGNFSGPTADLMRNGLGQVPGPDGRMQTADSAWTVDVTPLRVAGDAVTFRLRWLRALDRQSPSTTPGAETELTLRPGQSMPLDTISSPPPNNSTEPCVRSLRVGIERLPEPDQDRRLIAADVWLVERMADGSERSQSLSLRGLYSRGIPFYFDRLTEGPFSFDLFGELEVGAGAGPRPVTITLKNRGIEPRTPGAPAFLPNDYTDTRRVTATLALDEVVSVALPRMGESRAWGAAFARRQLSLRIRVRELR